MPPVAERLMLPFGLLQVLPMLVVVRVSWLGLETMELDVAVHPLASLTNMLYVPEDSPLKKFEACAEDPLMLYVIGAVPPDIFEVIDPFDKPKHVTSLTVLESKLGPPSFCMMEFDCDVHPLLSVTKIE